MKTKKKNVLSLSVFTSRSSSALAVVAADDDI